MYTAKPKNFEQSVQVEYYYHRLFAVVLLPYKTDYPIILSEYRVAGYMYS